MSQIKAFLSRSEDGSISQGSLEEQDLQNKSLYRKGIDQNDLQFVVQLVQQWLSTNKSSKNPVVVHSMRLMSSVQTGIPNKWTRILVIQWTCCESESKQAKSANFLLPHRVCVCVCAASRRCEPNQRWIFPPQNIQIKNGLKENLPISNYLIKIP